MFGRPLLSALALCLIGAAPSPPADNIPSRADWVAACEDWAEWDKPGPPFRIYGNTYYVGTCGTSSILITGAEGHVLIDGGTKAGGALVAANIERLGFAIDDVKILLFSHEHHDHVGGLAELQRRSGARLLSPAAAAQTMATGKAAATDPQFGMHDPFPAVEVDGEVVDNTLIELGDIQILALSSPGHTPGATSFQWHSIEAGEWVTLNYIDSLTPVSSDSYRFIDHPEYVEAFRWGLERLRHIGCGILLTPHPSASAMRTRMAGEGLHDPRQCSVYADSIEVRLDERLFEEAGPE